MSVIDFNVSKTECRLIAAIAKRAVTDLAKENIQLDFMDTEMDITACHANGTPLDLEKLLAFPAFDFMHDILGICRHLNRTTGKMAGCFLPRCSK